MCRLTFGGWRAICVVCPHQQLGVQAVEADAGGLGTRLWTQHTASVTVGVSIGLEYMACWLLLNQGRPRLPRSWSLHNHIPDGLPTLWLPVMLLPLLLASFVALWLPPPVLCFGVSLYSLRPWPSGRSASHVSAALLAL